MKWVKYLIISFIFIIVSVTSIEVFAQCAMCTMNAESSVQNGNTQGKGLNSGILYLLAAPYLAVAIVGYIWYKNYRKKTVAMNLKDEKINLN